MLRKLIYVAIASLLMAAMAVAGCTSPAPTASPSLSATAPTATPAATPAPTATPTPEPTITPTAVLEYSNNSPVSVSNIKIEWDTIQFEGQAKETATMTVKNIQNDSIAQDVVVLYKVTTPATFANPDGSFENRTNTLNATQNIGLMQIGEQRDVTFHVDHNKNVPITVSVTVQWRGGSAVVFNKTLNLPDHSFDTYEF